MCTYSCRTLNTNTRLESLLYSEFEPFCHYCSESSVLCDEGRPAGIHCHRLRCRNSPLKQVSRIPRYTAIFKYSSTYLGRYLSSQPLKTEVTFSTISDLAKHNHDPPQFTLHPFPTNKDQRCLLLNLTSNMSVTTHTKTASRHSHVGRSTGI